MNNELTNQVTNLQPRYLFPDDPELEKRVRYFTDTMVNLAVELGCARALLERAMASGKERLSLDALVAISKIVREIHDAEIRDKLLFNKEEAKIFVMRTYNVMFDVLKANLAPALFDLVWGQFIDQTHKQAKAERLLTLEAKSHESE